MHYEKYWLEPRHDGRKGCLSMEKRYEQNQIVRGDTRRYVVRR